MKVKFVNLGCSKNLVDSERMAGMLKNAGVEITEDESEAMAVVINTCSFIEDARKEAVETILAGTEWKKEYPHRRLFVVGCLPQRYPEELLQEIPEIDGSFGVGDYQSLVNNIVVTPAHSLTPEPRFAFTPRHYRYLRIADGCDRHCTYCAIPGIRGRYQSRPLEELVAEAEMLVSQGAKEIILIAQELNSYGQDLDDRPDLPALLKKLTAVEAVEWIRMLYLHPPLVDDSLLEIVASEPKICPYFDFPVEHISDSILKRMGRRINKKQTIEKLQKIKETIPGAAIRTSIMTGFPGETEQDFTELADFISDGWFDHLGIFAYSPEEGTPAAKFSGSVPEDVAQFRLDTLMEIQREVSAGKNQLLLNSTPQVIVDGFTEEGRLFGRTEKQAPDVDGIVFLNGKAETGEIVPVVIKYTEDYDLFGDILLKDELKP